MFSSFASKAVRRMARRIALLVFGRASGGPDERLGMRLPLAPLLRLLVLQQPLPAKNKSYPAVAQERGL